MKTIEWSRSKLEDFLILTIEYGWRLDRKMTKFQFNGL